MTTFVPFTSENFSRRRRARVPAWPACPAQSLFEALLGAWTLRRAALPSAGLYPLAAVGLTVLGYALGNAAHASGFLAVYVAGVVLGNARLPHRHAQACFEATPAVG